MLCLLINTMSNVYYIGGISNHELARSEKSLILSCVRLNGIGQNYVFLIYHISNKSLRGTNLYHITKVKLRLCLSKTMLIIHARLHD